LTLSAVSDRTCASIGTARRTRQGAESRAESELVPVVVTAELRVREVAAEEFRMERFA
jgi:hypothetical protein